MAVNTNATKLTDLVDPVVVADIFDRKLTNAIKFAPLCDIDYTLVGQPGSTVKVPSWTYISAASTTAEGTAITIHKLAQTALEAKIAKIANGVEITDEAVLSGFGDAIGEAANQLALSVADALDADIISVLGHTSTGGSDTQPVALAHTVATSGKVTADDVADALVKFGEDIDGDKVLMVSAADYGIIRKATGWISGTDVAANLVLGGVVGMLHGCQVVVTNRLTAGNAYIVKPGAVRIYLKRDTMVESDRDIINKSTVMTVDKHYVCYLVDNKKAIKIS